MKRHWKIRNLTNRKAYFVTVDPADHNRNAVQQVYDFITEQLDIGITECRIIETANRFVNQRMDDYIMTNRGQRGV